jgi:hypothetical protein
MGLYNPHAPRIIGNEFVGIRDENLIFDPLANSFERGTGFTLSTARNVAQVRGYVNQVPPGFVQNNAMTASIYPRGVENDSGPIRSVIIPCNGGFVTGNASVANSTSFIGGAATVAQAFWNQSAETGISYRVGELYRSGTGIFFAVNQYANLLYDKRILGVNWIVGVDVGSFTSNGGNDQGYLQSYLVNDFLVINGGSNASVRYPDLYTPTTPDTDVRVDRIRLGDVSRFYGVVGAAHGDNNINIQQWTYTELQRFEESNPSRIMMYLRVDPVGVTSGSHSVIINYSALEVFYCEETRVGYGTKLIQYTVFDNAAPKYPYTLGANWIAIRNKVGTGVILQPGDYTVTLNQSNLGDSYDGLRTAGRAASWNELRALYEVPTAPGVQVNIPYPLNNEAIEQTLTRENTLLIPQISMHASGGGVLYESQGYGRQTAGQVWTNNSVIQRVDTSPLSATANYPWIRYWARRYCDTTGPLTVTSGASTATISVADFDALDEIVDRWRQISLRWDTPLALANASFPFLTWSSTNTAGNRYEILGVSAPAITGISGVTQLNLVASPNSLFLTTYGQPVSGGLISESWIPQLGPYVSGATFDSSSDVSFLLAQDLLPVTGFTSIQASQTVTGIGLNCGLPPGFIPSAISYVRLGWSATSSAVPVTGFGYYEIQRSDTLTDWQTIAKMTSPGATGFNDFEARIGLLASYRIRAVDIYGFYNAWSTTSTVTISAPGVVGTSIGANDHVLVFTTNTAQSGVYNLAYCMAWESQPIEEFDLPEAGFTQLQTMYDRDFFTAFRPLERGGESFSRQILVQAAAIAPETLADFTSLRDMAWASVPYICVRDEDGNRWFANVQVPAGRVMKNRTLYLAPIQITEVTATAAPVQP